MKRRLLTLATVGITVAGAAAVYALVDASHDSTATRAGTNAFHCSTFQIPAPVGAIVDSLTTADVSAGTFQVPGSPPLGGYPVPEVPAHCEVTVTLTHPGANDHAKVQVWLPESGWNGRFQAVGGAAYAAGNIGGVATAVKQGYAAATTDAGVDTSGLDTGWGLDPSGKVNAALLENFSSRSVHELAIVGKQVVKDVYGNAASYAYWNGCSTGGRQGYMEAQKYPADFNGINADAPAINWNQFEVATLWPQVVMNEAHTYPTACEFSAFNQAAVKECDAADGLADGLISDPAKCAFDPRRLIGTKVQCDGKEYTISESDAEVVRKIWDGPRDPNGKQLWFGLPTGADFTALTAATSGPDGVTTGVPFIVPAQWVATFVEKQPKFDTAHLTYAQFDQIFQQARAEYDPIIGTADPDLSAFRAAGGKLITWQGDADQLIPTAGTVDYRHRVEAQMGGSAKVDDFYRVFLAPGVAHCALTGDTINDLTALTAWVEHGRAPEVLRATLPTPTGRTASRDLCRFPLVSHYSGDGDPTSPASFRCVAP
ncbi:tannase/feruloyl esterase family alpha/beta hydrolase [Nocardia sp. NEAU-G5]|uniref:Tannase/feruloyl esterase family alpha/beta hydrolase n=1 Tax=Nocardia albiluteola TaxID=2842303 RepID=A0ABS6B9R6_9NOCA|nr:tannase/feruloyl esterase family alpha/beta hydrolase [Nocardia albiluteola]MBU3067041.1 tannase/feruloyl esterase family alpha/beta hydrolase [Nocardia albiluteola]